jgi:hypothetical protein
MTPAMAGRINIGLRHILPVFIPISIFAAVAVWRIARALPGRAFTIPALVVLLAIVALPGIRPHPDYISYVNAFAGGAPEEFIADSDLDWGQGFKLASRRLRELHAADVAVNLFYSAFPDNASVIRQYGFPPNRPLDDHMPHEGWTLISPTQVGVSGRGWHRHGAQTRFTGNLVVLNPPWYSSIYPNERIGGLLLYYVPPGFTLQ